MSQNKILADKISIIVNYYNIGHFDKVINETNRILKKNPAIDFLWNILGLTYQNLKDYGNAEKKLLKALNINTKNLSAINNLGNNYKYVHNFNKAEEYFLKALKIKPDYVSALVNYGNLKFQFNKFEDSLKLLNKALAINHKTISIHLNLSLVYQSLGNFDKAIDHLNIINSLDPNYTRIDNMISALLNYNNDQKHFDLMQDKLKCLKLSDNQKIPLYFGLSKAYEDKKEFSKAAENFEKGNNLKRKQSNYSIDKDKDLFQQIKTLFTNYEHNKLTLNPSKKKIIFIIGMPRSGTTLVEQIVSSHKNVFGAGELNYLHQLIYKKKKNSDDVNFSINLVGLDAPTLNIITQSYFDFIANFSFKEDFIIDKTLLNFQLVGFIRLLFPNSKIIHCERNPKANCLSIYKHLFEHEGPWCYNKKELNEYYNLYLDLMTFWEKKFPGKIYNIKYEDLILNPDAEIKKLIDGLKIGWDANCIKFYENKNAIKTLSVNQARKKIYSSSLGLYEKYKAFLKEF
jgi:tetratricopeptide (TPR) repeat protein